MITESDSAEITHDRTDVIPAEDVVGFCLVQTVVEMIVRSNLGVIISIEQIAVAIESHCLNLKINLKNEFAKLDEIKGLSR